MAVDRNELILQFKYQSGRANAEIQKTEKNLNRMRLSTQGLRRSLGALRNNLLLVSFAFAGVAASIGGVVRVSSRFEAVKTRLVGLTGSVEGAEQAFKRFNEIASTTPFTLDDVVNAGAQLEAFGANSNELLKEITDLAAFMGTTATEAANAFGRAYAGGAGAADILRERGILNIVKESQKLKDLSKTTLPEFRKALIEALQDPAVGIEGSTDRLSETFVGAFSNMKDAITLLAAEIGDTLMPNIKNAMLGITQLAKDATALLKEVKRELPEFDRTFAGVFAGELLEMRDAVKDFSKEQLGAELAKLEKQFAETLPTEIKKTEKAISDLGDSSGKQLDIISIIPLTTDKFKDTNLTLIDSNKGMIDSLGATALATKAFTENTEKAIEAQTKNMDQSLLTMEVDEQSRELLAQKIALLKELIAAIESQNEVEVKDPFEEMLKSVGREGQLALRFADQLGDAFAQAALTADSFKQTAERAIRSIAATIISNMATFAIMSAFFPSAMGGMKFGEFLFGRLGIKTKHDGGLIQGFASGGMIQGQDNVPILAQAGEFVMQRSAVQSIGLENLTAMNQTGQATGNVINVSINGGIVQDDYVMNTLIPAIDSAKALS